MTYRTIVRIFFYLFLLIPILLGQTKIRGISVEGNHYFTERNIREEIQFAVGTSFSPPIIEQIENTLLLKYHAEGFYTFRIDSIDAKYDDDSSAVGLTLTISEGTQTVLQEITVTGNEFFRESQLRSLFASRTGDPINTARLELDITSMLRLYSRNGFPFTRIHTDSIIIDPENEGKLSFHIVIAEGPRVLLDEVQVYGNISSTSKLIVREARLSKGEYFDDEKILRIRRRLERLQLFSSVSEPQLYIIASEDLSTLRGGLSITVKEGNTNSFDGIVGYVPSNSPNTNGYFTGDVFLAFRNLFGTGRKAKVKWKRENEFTQELELHYLEPWVIGLPLNIGITYYQRKQDSTYVKMRFNLRGEYSITEELIVAGSIVTESVYPSADRQQFSVFESNTLSAFAEIIYDTRNNILNPTEGIRYSTAVQQGRKNITGPQQYLSLAAKKNYSIQQYSFAAEWYVSTFQRQVMLFGANGKQITSSGLEVSDLFQFGGTNSVRGYRENQFQASKVVWVNLEYRFLTGRASSIYGFVDGGYFYRPAILQSGIVSQESSIIGYGLGTRVETGLGILNVSYALGKGDSFSTGKIHVGIVNEF